MKTLKQKNKEKLQVNFFLKASKGFTLVEMITAVAIFSLVMVIGMGALLNVLHANKQTQAIQTAVNNLNLAMEMMSREIRTGYYYHCGSGDYTLTRDCLVGDSSIAFDTMKSDIVVLSWLLILDPTFCASSIIMIEFSIFLPVFAKKVFLMLGWKI